MDLAKLLDGFDERDAPLATSLRKQELKVLGYEPATHPRAATIARLLSGALTRLSGFVQGLADGLDVAAFHWRLRASRWDKRPVYDLPKKVVWGMGRADDDA